VHCSDRRLQEVTIADRLVGGFNMIFADRVDTFRRMHESGCFVMANPWDVGSARALEQLGFPALATTSAGFAWILGR